MPTIVDWQDAIKVLEQQRGMLADDVLETALAALRAKVNAHNQADASGPWGSDQSQQTALLHAVVVTGWLSNDTSSTGRMLTTLFELQMRLKTIATEHGGKIAVHAGYDVIASFHAEHTTHAVVQAVEAATRIRTEVQKLKLKRLAAPYVQIGVHFSRTYLDSNTHRDHHDLRLLQELKDSAGPNEILLSYTAYRESREQYSVHYAKSGKLDNETVRMYRLVSSRRTDPPHQDAIYGITTRIIGRQNEQEWLQESVRQSIIDSQLRMVALAGPAGSGKSRLVREFVSWIEVIPEPVLYFEAHTSRYTLQQPFALLRSLIARRANITSSDTNQTAHDRLVNMLLEIIGEDQRPRAEALPALLGLHTPNLTVSQPYVNLRQLRETAFSVMLDYMQGLLQRFGDPMVIVLEDIHYIDENSLQFLQLLLQRLQDYPITIVATLNQACHVPPMRTASIRQVAQCRTINTLPTHAIELLIAELLRNVPDLTPEDSLAIAAVADGKPGYVWEHIRWLINIGALVPGPGEWRLDRSKVPAPADTPPIEARILARLRQLPGPELRVLQAAALTGEIFWDTALAALLRSLDEITLSAGLHELSRLNLIRPRSATTIPGSVEYTFEDVLYRDLAYSTLDTDLRQQFHAAFATWLIGSGINRTGQYSSTIAYHFQQANDVGRAAKWYILAGQQSVQSYAPHIARDQFEAAREILKAHDNLLSYRLEALDGLGAVYFHLAQYADARYTNEAVLALTQDPRRRATSFAHLGQTAERIGDIDGCLQMTRQAEAIASGLEGSAHQIWIWIHLNYARAYCHQGDYNNATEHAEAAIQRCQYLDDDLLASSYAVLGLVQLESNQLELASVYFNKAQVLARQFSSRRLEAQLQDYIGTLASRRGDLKTAALMHKQALETATLISSLHTVLSATVNLAGVAVERGQFRHAHDLLDDLMPALRASQNQSLHCLALCTAAAASVGLSALDMAATEALQAFRSARTLYNPMHLGLAWRVLGQVGAAGGYSLSIEDDSYSPEACFAASIAHFEKLGNQLEIGLTLRHWSLYEHKLELHNAARQRWQTAMHHLETANALLLAQKLRLAAPDALTE